MAKHQEAARPQGRIEELVSELERLLEQLCAGGAQERRLAYASCIPLLSELGQLNRTQLAARELNALTREAGWHLRSLAGLASQPTTDQAQHAAWARQSLREIVRQTR